MRVIHESHSQVGLEVHKLANYFPKKTCNTKSEVQWSIMSQQNSFMSLFNASHQAFCHTCKDLWLMMAIQSHGGLSKPSYTLLGTNMSLPNTLLSHFESMIFLFPKVGNVSSMEGPNISPSHYCNNCHRWEKKTGLSGARPKLSENASRVRR